MKSDYLININGTIGTPDQVKISVLDRGLLFGDSVYEVTRTYNRRPCLIHEHLDRLYQSTARIGITMPCNRSELTGQMQKSLDAFFSKGAREAYIRIIVTRGEGEIGLDPDYAEHPNLIIIVREQKQNPESWYQQGVKLVIADILRNPPRSMDPSVKSGNYLNNLMAFMQAKEQAAFEAVMLNEKGMVTEGTTSNIWLVKNNIIKTPPLEAGLLSGITRQAVLIQARKNGYVVREENFLPQELYSADEVFITSSTRELVPVYQIDEHKIDNNVPGSMTLKLLKLYREFLASNN